MLKKASTILTCRHLTLPTPAILRKQILNKTFQQSLDKKLNELILLKTKKSLHVKILTKKKIKLEDIHTEFDAKDNDKKTN